MLLGTEILKPMGKAGFGIETGDIALGRMENDIDTLALRLALHKLNGHIQIKMLTLDMIELMGQNLLPALLRKAGIYINIKGAIVIGNADTLHTMGQINKAEEIINHLF